MAPTPTVSIDIDVATTLRDWLWQATRAADGHAPAPDDAPMIPSALAEPLAELAAALDTQIGDAPDHLDLAVGRPTPRGGLAIDHDDPYVDGSPVATPERDRSSTPPASETSTPPDDPVHAEGDGPDRDDTPAPAARVGVQLPDKAPAVNDELFPYVAVYECSACATQWRLPTTHKVGSFAVDCPACGLDDVRFVVASMPDRRAGGAGRLRSE